MIGSFQLRALQENLDGRLLQGDCEFNAVCTDTRTLKAGELFIALRGPNFDGNDFLAQVAAGQAAGALVERADENIHLPQLQVEDSTRALGLLAQLQRRRFARPVVGITGSSGKTSVKEMLASIFAEVGLVHATAGNLNNQIGVPLTLFGLQREHQFAVIEMGTNAPGEIAWLAEISEPDIALVNNVGPAHIGHFASLAAIAEEKGAIYRGLTRNGTAVINCDDEFADVWRAELPRGARLEFSVSDEKADLFASEIESAATQTRFRLSTPAGSAVLTLAQAGMHAVSNAVAAATCAFAAGVGVDAIAAGLNHFRGVKGRQQRMDTGNPLWTLIDDSYNANPSSMKAAIDVLASHQGSRLLIVGDMGELGEQAAALHAEVGRYARRQGIENLWVIGEFADTVADAFGDGAKTFNDHESLAGACMAYRDQKLAMLVKGSRSSRMENVVHLLSRKGE